MTRIVGSGEVLRRFWERVQVGDGCWIWTGARSDDGYALFLLPRVRPHTQTLFRASRLMLILETGAWLPENIEACHTCDNPICVRPDHLFAGTRQDNVDDMVAKGRQRRGGAQQTHCRNGHPLTPDNIDIGRDGRRCRRCNRAWQRERRRIRRNAA